MRLWKSSDELTITKKLRIMANAEVHFNDIKVIGAQGAAIADTASATQLTPPAGGSGATAGAYDSAANRNLMIASITAGAVDLAAVAAKLDVLLATLRTHGLIAT